MHQLFDWPDPLQSAPYTEEKTSIRLWEAMPNGFLKRGFPSFDKLGHDVKQLIFELAKHQNFRCALCLEDTNLVIEHEHNPREKTPLTIFNIRGLVCDRCNKALMGRDMEERGYLTRWENGYPYLSDQNYEDYKYRFDCRVEPLIYIVHFKQVGCRYPERARYKLRMLDQRYEEGRFPWQRRSEESWEGEIKTPKHALQVLAACMQFVIDQRKADANYQPPEEFWKVIAIIRPIIAEAMARRLDAEITIAHQLSP